MPTHALEYSFLTQASPRAAEDLNALIKQMSRSPRAMDVLYLERLLQAPGKIIVARDGDQIVGCAQILIAVLPSKVKGWIEDVVVDSGYRGQGVAHKLMEMAVDYARQAGCKHVNLTSGSDRAAAHNLYENMGFYRRDSVLYRLDLI